VRYGFLLVAVVASSLAPRTTFADARAALGLSLGWQQRQDYGKDTRSAFVPEMVGHLYFATAFSRMYLRPGVRLGFAGLDRAEMPSAVQVRERDLGALGEISLLRDGILIPSVTLGAGLAYRWLHLETRPPLSPSKRPIAEGQVLPAVYGQVGVGLPILRGLLVAEPHVRYDHVFGDDRIGWRFGADLTVRLF
jgi:hypothetical protein